MKKSKSKTSTGKISKWMKFFTGGNKSPDSRTEPETAITPLPPSPAPVTPVLENAKPRTIRKQKSTAEIELDSKPAEPKIVKQPIPAANLKGQLGTKREKKAEKVKSELVVPQAEAQKNTPKSVVARKKETKEAKDAKEAREELKKEQKEQGSDFEAVDGPATPLLTGSKGIKDKMRWKIDVEGVDIKGDQKMTEVLEKVSILRSRLEARKVKLLKENEMGLSTTTTTPTEEEPEPTEDTIINCARALQVVKLESLISKEISEADQKILRGYCRSGDQEEKAEISIEKIAVAVLNAVVQKNEFIRHVVVSGELRMFAVDEKKAKVPMMALMMARKDLTYVAWAKCNKDVENTIDGTWAGMAVKKGSGAQSIHSTPF
ncbi:DUF7774 domain-containing protein [Caenorhabditis elegans]|uniref:WH2 domain-containing protein n=1 Tax=Caenorhabditis elegans TaxID=6239 RepID=O44776_CAEEL|nr:WH2 domain-containing protein [Caenorhabditis elegans]CCD66447.1 WH2 domain-containing protein [Caenorhabditis elegans]|eukprot:NP_491696.2 Uncharacterized protein CELE_F33D11.2 [Caenorhabditis elegans]